MNKMFSIKNFAFFSLLALNISIAHAATVIDHTGSNNPTAEGWNLGGTGTTGGGSEVTGSGNHNYWQVQDASTSSALSYTFDLTAPDLSGNWTAEFTTRVINSDMPFDNSGSVALIVADGLNYWSFYLSTTSVGPMGTNSGTLYQAHVMDTVTDYHNYKIMFSPNGAGTADDTADFYVDGSLVFGNVGRSMLFASAASPKILFGSPTTLGQGTANYESVKFDNGVSTVPIPAAAWLFGSGITGLLGLAKRQKAKVLKIAAA